MTTVNESWRNRSVRGLFISSSFIITVLFVVTSVCLSLSRLRYPWLPSGPEAVSTNISLPDQTGQNVSSFVKLFSGSTSALWFYNDIDIGVDEMIKNLLSMRFLFHGLCFLGVTSWYAKLRNGFLETLVFMVYINLFLQVTIAAVLRSIDERISEKPYILYAYSVCMLYSGLFLLIFHKFSQKKSLLAPRSLILDSEQDGTNNMNVTSGEQYVFNRITTGKGAQISGSDSCASFMQILKWIQILEICRSAALVSKSYAEATEMELINNALHSCILPTFGWYAWSSISSKRMNANAAISVYIWKLVLTLILRISALIEKSSYNGADSKLYTGLGLFLCVSALTLSLFLYRNSFCLDSYTKTKPWYWIHLHEMFQVTNGGSSESVGDKTRQSAPFDVRVSVCPCINQRGTLLYIASVSVALFSLLWILEAMVLSITQIWIGASFQLSIASLNAAGHAAAIFGMQFYAIDNRLNELMAHRKRFVLAVNFAFLVLSGIQWYINLSPLSRCFALVRSWCCIVTVLSIAAFHVLGSSATGSEISYSSVENNANQYLPHQINKQKIRVIVSVAAVIITFILLGISVFLDSHRQRPGMVIKFVEEILFHFAFLLPILAWTGVKFNHRLNIAYAVLGHISVSCICFVIMLALLLSSASVISALCFSLCWFTSGICAILLFTLRRVLIAAQVPQGDIVWRIEIDN